MREESEIPMVAAKSEREEAEVASPVASLNMDAAAGAESPPQDATSSSRDTIDGRGERVRKRASERPLAPRNHDE